MALSDLAVYSEYAYATMTEVQDQQVELFNAASDGTIILVPSSHQGDWSDVASYKKIDGGTVRTRNAYASTAIAQKRIEHLVERSIKLARGTPEFVYEPSNWKWITQNPEQAGIAFGQQLAGDNMANMLNTAIGALVAALSGEAEVVYDISADAGAAANVSYASMLGATAKFGDRSQAIRAWFMHSAAMFGLWGANLNNGERLFNYGTVNVQRDPFGRLYIITDSPQLVTGSGAAAVYNILGLTPGAAIVGQNSDYNAAEVDVTGLENIQKKFQAEWSIQLGIEGFAWETTGGKSPADAAVFTTDNWGRYATSHKDLAGVLHKAKVGQTA